MGYVTPRHQKMVVHHHWYWQFAPPCHALPIPALPKTPKNWCFGTSDNSPNMILEIGQLVGRLSKSNPGPVPQHFITVSCSCHPHASIECGPAPWPEPTSFRQNILWFTLFRSIAYCSAFKSVPFQTHGTSAAARAACAAASTLLRPGVAAYDRWDFQEPKT